MTIRSLSIAFQVVGVLLLIGIAVLSISALEDGATALKDARSGAQEELAEGGEQMGGAVGLIVILSGCGVLALLVTGTWVRRCIAEPLAGLERTVGTIASGNLQRRVDETAALSELSKLGENVNSIVDRLRQLEQRRETESLLTRAAIEHLLDEGGRPGALLDTSGRLIASNDALRAALRGGEIESGALLGRSKDPGGPELVVDEVRDADVICGFVSRIR